MCIRDSSKAEWDKEQLIRDLREEWGIVDDEPAEGDEDVENSDDAVVTVSYTHLDVYKRQAYP